MNFVYTHKPANGKFVIIQTLFSVLSNVGHKIRTTQVVGSELSGILYP